MTKPLAVLALAGPQLSAVADGVLPISHGSAAPTAATAPGHHAASARPRRHRPVNPHAAANALALQHQDIAERVAANIARRTGHPREDLHQIAMLGILQAARRY